MPDDHIKLRPRRHSVAIRQGDSGALRNRTRLTGLRRSTSTGTLALKPTSCAGRQASTPGVTRRSRLSIAPKHTDSRRVNYESSSRRANSHSQATFVRCTWRGSTRSPKPPTTCLLRRSAGSCRGEALPAIFKDDGRCRCASQSRRTCRAVWLAGTPLRQALGDELMGPGGARLYLGRFSGWNQWPSRVGFQSHPPCLSASV